MAYNTPEKIIDFSMIAHGDFVQMLLNSFDRIAKDEKETPIDAARRALSLNIPLLAQLIGDSALASLLWGAAGVSRRLPRSLVYGSPRNARDIMNDWNGGKAWMPLVSAAVRHLEGLRPMLDWVFESVAPATRKQAFTVTGIAIQKALESVQKSLVKALEQGQSFPTWYEVARKALATGPVGISRAQAIYRFNGSQAFHNGQERVMNDPIVGNRFPYIFVHTIRDSRISEPCRIMGKSGLRGHGGRRTACFRRDDPAYIRNRTPRHINCRCKDSPMTVSQAAKLGIREAVQWELTGETPLIPSHVPYFEVAISPKYLAEERGSKGDQYAA